MGGLIPLLLPTSTNNRSSIIAKPAEMQRPASAMAAYGPVTSSHRRQLSLPLAKSTKQLFISTPTAEPVLPSNSDEWKSTINEVKRKYVSRKYRSCSARCCEILDHLKDTSNVETLHLVYLHFYAASSLEMCARPLSQSSAYRTKLLGDAREHYDMASALIKKAEETGIEKTRSASSASTTFNSHSPSMSISSISSSVYTSLSSPRNSISSIEDIKSEVLAVKPKKKKKVSFSGLPEIDIPKKIWQPEPYIRPDSPTLGWEEDHFLFGQGEFTTATAPSLDEPVEMVSPKSVEPVVAQNSPLPPLDPVPEENQIQDTFDLESFLQARSMNRIVAQLSALRSQIAWHRDNIDTLMTETEEIPEVPETPTVPEVPLLPGLMHSSSASSSSSSSASSSSSSSSSDTDEQLSPPTSATILTPRTLENALSQQLKESFGDNPSFDLSARFSLFGGQQHPGFPEAWERSRSGSVCSTASSALSPRSVSQLSNRSNGDDALQKRIERLRANGWQRKRFDSRRYEALRESVLTELGA